MTIDECVKKYKYKPLPYEVSYIQKAIYKSELPKWCHISGDTTCPLLSNGRKIARGYSRVVIGDYGAYIEIPLELMETDEIEVKKGEEYRFTERYRNVKYYWYNPIGNPNVKIYLQKNRVSYADYQIGMFYISPHELDDVDSKTI